MSSIMKVLIFVFVLTVLFFLDEENAFFDMEKIESWKGETVVDSYLH